MKKLRKDNDNGLPAVGKLLDDFSSDLPENFNRFFIAVARGFEKFFSPPFEDNKK